MLQGPGRSRMSARPRRAAGLVLALLLVVLAAPRRRRLRLHRRRGRPDRVPRHERHLLRTFSRLSDDTVLDYPYGVQVIEYPG